MFIVPATGTFVQLSMIMSGGQITSPAPSAVPCPETVPMLIKNSLYHSIKSGNGSGSICLSRPHKEHERL